MKGYLLCVVAGLVLGVLGTYLWAARNARIALETYNQSRGAYQSQLAHADSFSTALSHQISTLQAVSQGRRREAESHATSASVRAVITDSVIVLVQDTVLQQRLKAVHDSERAEWQASLTGLRLSLDAAQQALNQSEERHRADSLKFVVQSQRFAEAEAGWRKQALASGIRLPTLVRVPLELAGGLLIADRASCLIGKRKLLLAC